jgi:hypothetical protein
MMQLGAAAFKAPELLLAHRHKLLIDVSNGDAYSCGCCMHLMLQPDPAFRGWLQGDKYDYVPIPQHSRTRPGYPIELCEFVALLLAPAPVADYTVRAEIGEVLEGAANLLNLLPAAGADRLDC